MGAQADSSDYEPVHFVEGYVEGVLNGTADYRGTPHHFELRAAEPNTSEVYLLTPLSPEVFAAVSEAWQIWRRAQQGRHATPAKPSDFVPALPQDRERQAELRGFVSNWLASAKPSAFLAEGDFEQVAGMASMDAQHSLRVKWSRVAGTPAAQGQPFTPQ